MREQLDEKYGGPSKLIDVVVNDKIKIRYGADERKLLQLIDTVD